jgi:hypothetical protein
VWNLTKNLDYPDIPNGANELIDQGCVNGWQILDDYIIAGLE